MTLVLQCAMCGTHQPVGTPACQTCRASGVGQLRLMFECPTCGLLDISPICGACPPLPELPDVGFDMDGLIVAEEVPEFPFALELDEADGAFVVDLSEAGETVLELGDVFGAEDPHGRGEEEGAA